MVLAAKELCATQSTDQYSGNIPSNTRTSNDKIVSQLPAQVTKLASDMEPFHQRFKKIKKLNRSPRSKTVSTPTTRSGTSGTRTSRKSQISNLIMNSAKKSESLGTNVKREARDRSPHNSSYNYYSQERETPRLQ